MFGHQRDDKDDDLNPALPPEDVQATVNNQRTDDNNTIIASPINHPLSGNSGDDSGSNQPAKPEPVDNSDNSNNSDQAPTDNPSDDSAGDYLTNDEPEAPTDNAPAEAPAPKNDAAEPNDLLGIKQGALQQLSPLIGHIDQTPEEKFRTTMMMIQASDNQSLIKTAYEAAQQIGDEKERAQALLDVINEINYFTHQSTPEDNK